MMRTAIALPLLCGMFTGTQVQVVGSIGITELICFVMAPIILAQDMRQLKRNGFMPVIWLSLLCCVGCCLSSWYNNTPIPSFLRGFAMTYSLFALPICLHRILKQNLSGLKWILTGCCISMIINVFVFRKSVEVSMMAGGIEDANTAELIMNGPLFWLQRLGGWINLPITGWYLNTPILYTAIAPFIMVLFTILTTETGRSELLCVMAGVGIAVLGHKKVSAMKRLQKNLFILLLLSVIGVVLFAKGYSFLAVQGALGEKAQQKYERQMHGKSGIAAIIMGGRSEFFMGLYACLKNPFWGYGPWNEDVNGYNLEFLQKYGDYEAYEEYAKGRAKAIALGYRLEQVQSHSHIIGFWVRYSLLAMPFWVYIFCKVIKHFRYNLTSVPQWYGYFALGLPVYMWHIFFSPYGNRFSDCLCITCLLIADAVRRGKILLPEKMIIEALQQDSIISVQGKRC